MTSDRNSIEHRCVAAGESREDGAALFGPHADDLFLTTYADFDSEVDLGLVTSLMLAAGVGSEPVLSSACDRLDTGQVLALSVEYAGGSAGRAAVRDELHRHPGVHIIGVRRLGGRTVLDLAPGDPASTAERTAVLDGLDLAAPGSDETGATASRPVDRPARKKAPAAPPPPPQMLPVRLLGRLSGLFGATSRRGRLGTLLALGLLAALVLVAILVLIGTSGLGAAGVVVTLVLLLLLGQAVLAVLVLFGLRHVEGRISDLERIGRRSRALLDRRTKRILGQGLPTGNGKDSAFVRRYTQEMARIHARNFKAVQATQQRLHIDTQRQVQANLNLLQLVKLDAGVPPMGGWAASPDLTLLIMDTVLARKPGTVVECGSGISTLFIALTAEQHGLHTRVVALEHDARFKKSTEELLERHGMSHRAEVRLAPLVPGSVAGHPTPWYDESALDDLTDIGVLVIDGPPTATGEHARYPAVPLMREKLSGACTIIMDDLIRDSDREVAQRWQELLPDFSLQVINTFQKQVGLFERG